MGGPMAEMVVIGGGVVGAAAAYRLVRDGVRTTLIDRGDTGQATAAGAGIISPGTSLRPLPAFYPFAAAAVGHYPALLDALAADGAPPTGYEVVGELLVATDDAAYEQLPELLALFQERRAGGMPNLGEVSAIDGAEARERFPALGGAFSALWVPEVARVDGRLLRDALRHAALG
ncbi:MAG: FAD-binding oxidoreductase, partial [Chloroflexota bacterium]|nr:FAD-binding oxidoreductase [Chloroflexota bacterium]